MLGICSVSSRTIMYAVNKEIFFLILAVEDAVLQSAMNLYDKGQPLADQLVLSKLWKRGFKLSDTGEVVQHDDLRRLGALAVSGLVTTTLVPALCGSS